MHTVIKKQILLVKKKKSAVFNGCK